MKTALIMVFIFLGQPYNIELAITPVEQATGLMYRKEWTKESQGMLFVNNAPRKVSFWMKNTYLPLTMYYLDANFNILEINHPAPLDESGVTSKSGQVQYIFELDPKLEKHITKNWKEFSKILKQQLKEKENEISKIQN